MGPAPSRSALDFFPASRDLVSLRSAAAGCEGCDLYLAATRTVFGEGDPGAAVMLVGEQPGDEEDVEGRPFVGPASRELDEALQRAGLDRSSVWVTNVVKHFKNVPRGARRMHVKPSMLEVRACRPWLDAEIELVEPDVVVLLGATAAQAVLGRSFRMTRSRGEWAAFDGRRALATWHPSAILRAPEREDRHRMRAELAEDLSKVAAALAGGTRGP
ncbi:MAG: UdgX family uracil-DNA binding protein [Coriobacteriia bacterium]|nr:UdgX family uracil-DNA binding protein [Coriobacteriia bacterium]